MSHPQPMNIPESIFQTQEEKVAVQKRSKNLFIGIPKETCMQENRIPITPEGVRFLVNNGSRVMVETGAGLGARYTDKDYSEAGAEISRDTKSVFECDIVVKVEPPSLEELEYFKLKQTLISAIQLKTRDKKYFEMLMKKKVTAISFEHILDEAGAFPFVRGMSEIAGVASVHIAAEYLSNAHEGKGYLFGGLTGVPPTEVVIIGAGTVGEYAARAALGMGALVKVFDESISKLKRLQESINIPVYTCVLHPNILKKALKKCDVAIGAVRGRNGRTPCIVTEDMVEGMKRGSVIIDVSVDQGGCFETSELTDHDNPTFIKHDVIHYCVPNIPSRVSRSASFSLSNNFAPLLQRIADEGGVEEMLKYHPYLRAGLYMYRGVVTDRAIGEWFDLPYSDPGLLFGSL